MLSNLYKAVQLVREVQFFRRLQREFGVVCFQGEYVVFLGGFWRLGWVLRKVCIILFWDFYDLKVDFGKLGGRERFYFFLERLFFSRRLGIWGFLRSIQSRVLFVWLILVFFCFIVFGEYQGFFSYSRRRVGQGSGIIYGDFYFQGRVSFRFNVAFFQF